jgi:hypothetical protein
MGGNEDSAYGTGESTVIFNFLQVGAAYRW